MLLKVLKDESGGGKQRKISGKFELRPYAVYNGVRYLEGAGLRYKVVNGREEEWNGVDLWKRWIKKMDRNGGGRDESRTRK